MDSIKTALKQQAIETPSWGYGNSGTRFKTFSASGAARDVWEKLEDAALIHDLSGIAPSVALHIPWDKVKDMGEVKSFAEDKGIRIGAINPNVFQADDYKLGSLAHPDEKVREKAVGHLLECVEIMKVTGSKELSLWFADGTNYAGQDDFVDRKVRFEEGFKTLHDALPEGTRMLIEYKPFEPAFYHTDLADWGMAYSMALKVGDKAQVLVDIGHHLQGANIEHIVAFLLSEGKLGGFHFNNRRYADDDLIVGSMNPFELFCIYAELIKAERRGLPGSKDVAYMIDQSHNIEEKLEAMLLSVLNCQEAYAKALHIDFDALKAMQSSGDVLGAHRLYQDAFSTDVRPLLREVRQEAGSPEDPIAALREGGFHKARAEHRGLAAAGGGYPSGD